MLFLTLFAPKKAAALSLAKLKLKSFLPPLEGFSAFPYWDFKQWSWGYGTAAGFDKNKKPAGSITKEKAMSDLLAHMEKDFSYLNKLVKPALNGNQWAALLSFSYNAGTGNADNLVPNINAKNWQALETQWKKYIYAGGEVKQALIDRRAKEWQLFIS